MLDEVVTLDSDEEGKNSTITAKGVNGEDIVMQYNHKDYADLIGPPNAVAPRAAPTSVIQATPTKLPKRPGSMPPFALFSQETRHKLQAEDPDIGFGELGRKLGEMWHALKEEQKEDYRRRAREVADAKMKSWKETVSAIPKHKQLQLEQNQPRRRAMKIKKKKTSGYAIFCSEQRRKYTNEQPELQFSDISKKVAEDWRLSSEAFKKEYEEKAQRYNIEEEKRWRQRIYMQQQHQMKMQANRQQMIKQQQQQQTQQRLQQQQRYSQQQQQRYTVNSQQKYRHILPNYGQPHQKQRQYNPGNSSGLVISSVSSLSSPSKDMSGLKLPSGITIHRAEPEINLPSSITISRVEPEIQIVEENIVPQQPSRVQQAPKPTVNPQQRVMSRGRPVMARGARPVGMMRGRGVGRPPGISSANISPRVRGMSMVGRGSAPVGARMQVPGGYSRPRMPVRPSSVQGIPNGVSPSRGPSLVARPRLVSNVAPRPLQNPLKRPMMAPRGMAGMPPMKRPRMPSGNYGVSLNQLSYSTTGSINPATLSPFERLCRVCGIPNSVIFRLTDKTEVVNRLEELFSLKLDLKADEEEGFPMVVCRKCCNLVETFHQFSKQLKAGQEILRSKVRERKIAKDNEMLGTEELTIVNPSSPGSIGVDPLETSNTVFDSVESVVPDTQVGKIKIKQESLKQKDDKDEGPFTTVFTDEVDVKIKIEPGLGDSEKTEASGKADEAFKELKEEVRKLEREEEAQGKGEGGEKEKDGKEGGEKEKDGKEGGESGGALFDDYPMSTQDSGALFGDYPLLGAESVSPTKGTEDAVEEATEENDDTEFSLPVIDNITSATTEENVSEAETGATTSDSEKGQNEGATTSREDKEGTETNEDEDDDVNDATEVTDDLNEDANDVVDDATEVTDHVEEAGDDANKVGDDANEVGDDANEVVDDVNEVGDNANEVGDDANEVAHEANEVGDDTAGVDDDAAGEDDDAAEGMGDEEDFENGMEDTYGDGLEDIEADAPGVQVRTMSGSEDYYPDFYQGDEEEGVEGGEDGEDGDPLLGMESTEDNGVDQTDDFGGFDPLKLVQMTGDQTADDVDEEEEEEEPSFDDQTADQMMESDDLDQSMEDDLGVGVAGEPTATDTSDDQGRSAAADTFADQAERADDHESEAEQGDPQAEFDTENADDNADTAEFGGGETEHTGLEAHRNGQELNEDEMKDEEGYEEIGGGYDDSEGRRDEAEMQLSNSANSAEFEQNYSVEECEQDENLSFEAENDNATDNYTMENPPTTEEGSNPPSSNPPIHSSQLVNPGNNLDSNTDLSERNTDDVTDNPVTDPGEEDDSSACLPELETVDEAGNDSTEDANL